MPPLVGQHVQAVESDERSQMNQLESHDEEKRNLDEMQVVPRFHEVLADKQWPDLRVVNQDSDHASLEHAPNITRNIFV